MLAAFSFLLATSACESYDENPEYWWIGGGVAAVIVAIVALSGDGSDSSNGGSGDNGNGNGNGDNGNGNGGNGDLLGAPTSLAAVANGSSQINLSWMAPDEDGGSAITGYQIEYRQGSGAWGDLAADTGDADTDYDHNGLTAATSYSYRVSAINANGSGPVSNVAMATTASLAADPKPGVPTALTATPSGDGEVTISWTDPEYCGSGNACTDGNHQHYLEYRLTSASDDSWGNGAVVAGSPHATTYMVTGLDNGASYDFRLALQLTDEADRGPWADLSAVPEMDSDGDGIVDSIDDDDDNDGVADSSDAYPLDGCASADSDGDGLPDAVIMPGDSDMDGCETASPLAADSDDDNDGILDTSDAFPLDGCASADSDGDGDPDTIIMPGDSDADACTTASALAEDSDDDNDGILDTSDVDDDNDGLIEIASRAELENLRHNLAGSSYDDEAADSGAGDSGDTTGAPTTEPANCSDVDADGSGDPANDTVLLCGYELANDIDLGGTTSATTDDPPDISCNSGAWSPIGGCGSDGTCGEADSNDDNPFTAILEGNGFTLSNLCVEAVVENSDRHDVLGLFGHLGGATVQNLTIAEVYIESSFTGNDDNNLLGALVGYVTGDTAILNVAVTDSDSAIDLQGATFGENQIIGGLVGFQTGGSIIASYATGDVDNGSGIVDFVGGLVGSQTAGSIIASYATGDANGGNGPTDRVGGLVGQQDGGSIIASYATGNANGGDGIVDYVGGLVGTQTGGSITASYATGRAHGGKGTADVVGSLVGSQTVGSITASYGFGAVSGEEENGEAGTAWPSGVTAATHLSGDSVDTTTYAGAEWSTAIWDFGSDTQAPALLYVDGYDATADPAYTCAAASFPASLAVTCGATLLPGQR